MGFGQLRIERESSFRRCQPRVTPLPAYARAQCHFGQCDQCPGIGIVRIDLHRPPAHPNNGIEPPSIAF